MLSHIFFEYSQSFNFFTCESLIHMQFILVDEVSQESDSPIEIGFLPETAGRSSRKEVRHSQTVYLRGSQEKKKLAMQSWPIELQFPYIQRRNHTERKFPSLGVPCLQLLPDCWVTNINLPHKVIPLQSLGKNLNII